MNRKGDWQLAWRYVIRHLPDDLFDEIMKAPEVIQWMKRDSFRYWIAHSIDAEVVVSELLNANKIDVRTFESLVQNEQSRAEYLVESGLYGEDYSQYRIDLAEERKREQAAPGLFRELEREKYEFAMHGIIPSDEWNQFLDSFVGACARVLVRTCRTYDFLDGLAKIGKFLEADYPSSSGPGRSGVYEDDLNYYLSMDLSEELLATTISFNEDGEAYFSLSPFASAIQGTRISRIRRCEVCNKFFWAQRKDAFTCSKNHAKARQMRLLRQNWKDNGNLYMKARVRKKQQKQGI